MLALAPRCSAQVAATKTAWTFAGNPRGAALKPPPFSYHAPSSLGEALELAARLENPKCLAGGQSLMPMLNFRLVYPDHLIDLNPVGELSYIRIENGTLKIGATTRQRDIEHSKVVAGTHPILIEALKHVGHMQTRNRGTIGGSLCHLDPSAELPAVVLAIGGSIEAASVRGTRTIAMADFPLFFMTPAIEPDEIVTAVTLPLWKPGHGFAFEEFSRRHGDFAVVSASTLIELGPDGAVTRASIVLAGIDATPVRVQEAEAALLDTAADPESQSRAASCCAAIEAKADAFISAEYRQHLAGILAGRAISRAVSRARKDRHDSAHDSTPA